MKAKWWNTSLSGTVLLAFLTGAGSASADIDPTTYKESKEALHGNGGTGQYKFYFCSDHQPEHKKTRYIHFIINTNKDQALPIQWMKVKKFYGWIAEAAYWENDWAIKDSTPGQDKTAKIEFGTKRPLTEKDAPIYFDAPPKKKGKKEPVESDAAKSHIKGEFKPVKAEEEPNRATRSVRVQITFQATISKGTYTYSVSNAGPQEVILGTPQLSSIWEKLLRAKKHDSRLKSNWKVMEVTLEARKRATLYRIPVKETQTLVYVTKAERAVEEVVPVSIYTIVDDKAVAIASGNVTVFLPTD
jgi:hypothetical protein